jgi:DsbC/DsbD-like thiol-disulfide interchange protein
MYLDRLLTIALIGLIAGVASAQKAADLVQSELFTDTTHVEPGKPFRLAVRFHVKPEWHVYWKHPGETGLPTVVKLQLPEGFTSGEWQYPVPRRFVLPGDIIGYGYSDEVVLFTEITPPATLHSATISINARASYLVCEAVCIPGSNAMSIELPVGTAAVSKEAGEIDLWTTRVPKPLVVADTSGELNADGSPAEFSVTISLGQPGTDFQWFAQTPDALSLTDSALTNDGSSATIRFKAKVLSGFELQNSTLPVVVAYTDSLGVRRGVEVRIPLRKAE